MTPKRRAIASQVFAASCLIAFAVLSFGSALKESPTIDEPLHLTSGFLYWKTGVYFLDPIHPPLLRLWYALPVLFLHPHPPLPPPLWAIQRSLSLPDLLMNFSGVSSDLLVNTARSMGVLLGVGLGVLVWRWSLEVYGKTAAIAGLLAYSFCPVLLAYSHQVGTDFGSAAFSMLSLYLFWRFHQSPSRGSALAAGAAFGGNLASKFSGLLMLPVLLSAGALEKVLHPQKRAPSRKDFYLVIYALAAAGVLIAVYRVSEMHRIGQGIHDLTQVMHGGGTQYFKGVLNTGRPWFSFFTICFVLKTPLPFLLVMSAGTVLLALKRFPRPFFSMVWVLMPCVVYLGLISLANDQVGIRRILFLYPVMCVWVGGAVAAVWPRGLGWRIGCGFLGGWYVLGTLMLFPRYLSYFNELIGGPAQGHRYLVDCNLDWGQGLKELSRYLKKEGVQKIYLSYFGGGTPGAYGIGYVIVGPATSAFLAQSQEQALDLRKERRALWAISATSLSGAYFGGKKHFDFLKTRRPVAVILDSIFVYDLAGDPALHQELAALFRTFDNPSQARLEDAAATATASSGI